MFIIGIVIGIAAVNFSRSARDVLKTEGEQLSLLLQQARDDAITSGEVLAWKSENQVHAFYRLEADGKWRPIERDENFGVRQWPGDMRVAAASINGVKAATTDALVFNPSGFNAPFDMTLTLSDARITLRADPLGRIEIRE